MDAVMDLAARAVSFITLIQDTVLNGSIGTAPAGQPLNLKEFFRTGSSLKFHQHMQHWITHDLEQSANANPPNDPDKLTNFEQRAAELVWISYQPCTTEAARKKLREYTVSIVEALTGWINKHRDRIFAEADACRSFPTPYYWRRSIANILYKKPKERIALATALQYMPIQVVLALGGGKHDAQNLCLLQVWRIKPTDEEKMFMPEERKTRKAFEKESRSALEKISISHLKAKVEPLLANYDKLTRKLLFDDDLLHGLLQIDTPLPFEPVFREELNEIREGRKMRYKEQCLVNDWQPEKEEPDFDPLWNERNPFERAEEMKLYALAFSGGGIRSATFNLGILQALAKQGLLHRFDYISTVSGGGYIGSWLVTWIKREGSLKKVSDRLNHTLSPDPFGEEVRPVRWLRMYSNYLTPNASIMSVDAWTTGVTWLRNTLLNQLIILLLLITLFLTSSLLYDLWKGSIIWNDFGTGPVFAWSAVFLLSVAFLLGAGMQGYHKEHFPPIFIKWGASGVLSAIIIMIGMVGSYLVSAWFFSRPLDDSQQTFFMNVWQKAATLWPAGLTALFALVFIAIMGRYDRCMVEMKKSTAGWLIFYTAAVSVAFGLLCLALGWELLERIRHAHFIRQDTAGYNGFYRRLAFTIGSPLLLEIFGITVVARMALLGKHFPDERREWWGRMGAIINLCAFLWLLFVGASLLGSGLLKDASSKLGPLFVAVTGGWAVLIGSAVKAAFDAKTSGSGETKNAKSIWLELLSKTGPYLFILGLLFYLPALTDSIKNFGMNMINLFASILVPGFRIDPLWGTFIFIILVALLTYRLAYRVGVNEFSMHHFYRNRLVRAYLGATRRRTDRQKTANPFTGFDMNDDEKLSAFRTCRGYYGPYPILNTALNSSNVTTLDRQDRKAESFIFSPLYCGFDFSMTRASANLHRKSYDYGFRPTEKYAYPDRGPALGTAMAISGAAVNPNQGYHSSSATAFLLTVFNVQFGWWIGNPRRKTWTKADPTFGLGYLMYNLIGQTNTKDRFVCLSDGGHFDNMGLYELVRRRCLYIVLGDAEQDSEFTCEGLANAIRRCRIDFGVEIELDLSKIVQRKDNRYSEKNFVIGTIHYPHGKKGKILYFKSSITGQEPVDVREYALKNTSFPHQTTGDQFFDEEQFESYRKLGFFIAEKAFSDEEVMRQFFLHEQRPTMVKIVTDVVDKTKSYLKKYW